MRKNVVKAVAPLMAVALFATAGLAAKQVAKPNQIVIFVDDTFRNAAQGQAQLLAEYKKETGINLKIIQPIHNQYYEKMRLAFAAGDIPDVVELGDPHYPQYANEGAFVDLTKYVQASPTLKPAMKHLNAIKIKGKIYGIPRETPYGPITYVRKDWLTNLGMSAPATWEQYYKVMKAFTQKDPDKNGKNDTYGFTGPGPAGDGISLANNYYRDFYQNASPTFLKQNGKWVDGFSQPAMKPALERLRKVYMGKLIDPEIFTNKTSTCREKFNSGKAGMFSYWAGYMAERLSVEMGKNLGSEAKMIPIAAIKESHYLARVPSVNAITVKAKNPEGIFKYFLEYMHDGGNGQMLFAHGVKGVHWDVKNGKSVRLPSLDNPTLDCPKAYNDPLLQIVSWKGGKAPIAMDETSTESLRLFGTSSKQDKIQIFTDSRKKIEEPLNNAKNDCLAKVLTGAKTVEQGLSEYKKKTQELRLAQVLKDINAVK